MRFLLINPTSPLWRTDAPEQHRGPRSFRFSMLASLYVAAAMPADVDTTIVDEDVEPVDFDADVDLVGISFMTFNAPRAYQIADEFRRRGKTVIVGGYHPTFLPEEASTHADGVCVGEAEANIPEMIADFRAGRLKPIYRNPAVDLKGLAIPDRSLIRQGSYVTRNAMQATRGCPYSCTFCSVAAFSRSSFRTRPVDEVAAEIETLGRTVLFMDDNIIGNREYAMELFARLIPLRIQWASQCSIRLADDPELLDLAARSGCIGLFVGLESLSAGNIKAWRKAPNRGRDYARAIARLHAKGIAIYTGFVFGMDDDDASIFPRTLEFLHDARVDVLQSTILTPFPGTPLFDEMDRQGRITSRDWSHYDFGHVVFEPKHMSPRQLKTGMDWLSSHFYSRSALARRIALSFSYLSPIVAAKFVAPLNIGYRRRHQAMGTFERGRAFEPM